MREFITNMLNSFDLSRFFLSMLVMFEQIHQNSGAGDKVLGDLGEHCEESGITRNKANHWGKELSGIWLSDVRFCNRKLVTISCIGI
jgi:hypothetical protein